MTAELNKMAKSLSRRQFLAASMASAAGVALAGGHTLAAPEPKRASQTQTMEEYVWVGAVTAIAFWLDGQQGFRAAGDSLGVKTTYLGPVEYDPVAQMRILEELIASKPAGIMIFPADDQSLNDTLKQAMATGIPVVVVNHDVNDPTARYAFVGPDNVNVGRIGGQAAVNFLNGQGKVGFVTTTNPAHGQRVSGYEEVFAKHPGIQIVGSVDEQSDPNVALTVATQLLQ
ncbi:MAG: substrate-binding domain-containing protein, partial [Chloroflexota bacterium]